MPVNCGRDWRDDRATVKLKEWLLRKLGCDVVGVELSDDQLEDAITEAQEHWMQWVGRVRSVELLVQPGTVEYSADLLGPDVGSVVDVYFDSQGDGLHDVFGWADVEINPFQYVYEGRGGYSGIVQYMMYRESAKAIVSADKDWEWDHSRQMLILSPLNSDTRRVMVVYMSRCFDYHYLRPYEWNLFRQYALAKAMKTLANIRMKFPEKPSATGAFSMDGDTMYANAETIELNIEEKLRQMSHPTGILTG